MEIDNFTFCVSKELVKEVEGINIDLSYMGFTVESVKPLAQAGGSACGSCGTGGSCNI